MLKMACVWKIIRPSFVSSFKNSLLRGVVQCRLHNRTYAGICFNISRQNNLGVLEVQKNIVCRTEALESIKQRNFCTKKPTVSDINEKVLQVCNAFDKIQPNKATLDSHFMNDLGLDSLDHVELIMNMEEEFDFEISDTDAEKMLRPRDIVNYLVLKLQPEGCLQ